MKCNECQVANLRDDEALCFCFGCIQKMNASSMYEMGVKLRLFEHALRRISGLGRVCTDFDTCRHVGCNDSCAAKLIADKVLATRTPDPGRRTGGA